MLQKLEILETALDNKMKARQLLIRRREDILSIGSALYSLIVDEESAKRDGALAVLEGLGENHVSYDFATRLGEISDEFVTLRGTYRLNICLRVWLRR